MDRCGRLSEWCRYFDAETYDDAAQDVRKQMARLQDAYADLDWSVKQLAGSPGEVEETLRVARNALAEALEMLDGVSWRLRAGERDVS